MESVPETFLTTHFRHEVQAENLYMNFEYESKS